MVLSWEVERRKAASARGWGSELSWPGMLFSRRTVTVVVVVVVLVLLGVRVYILARRG